MYWCTLAKWLVESLLKALSDVKLLLKSLQTFTHYPIFEDYAKAKYKHHKTILIILKKWMQQLSLLTGSSRVMIIVEKCPFSLTQTSIIIKIINPPFANNVQWKDMKMTSMFENCAFLNYQGGKRTQKVPPRYVYIMTTMQW